MFELLSLQDNSTECWTDCVIETVVDAEMLVFAALWAVTTTLLLGTVEGAL
jgi:hypothetical protein